MVLRRAGVTLSEIKMAIIYDCFKTLILIAFIFNMFNGYDCRVLELDDRFREAHKSGKWLVMFYAPWCGHCKQMEPVWLQLGREMAEESSIKVARLDCTKFSSLAEIFGVRGFPTIKYIAPDNTHDYRGPRTVKDLIAFTQKAQGPAYRDLLNAALIEEVRKKHEVFYLYVGDEETDMKKRYIYLAKQSFLLLDFYSISAALMPDIKNTPTVLVYKDDTYYQLPLYSELSSWISGEQLPTFMELTGNSYQKMRSSGKRMAIIVLSKQGSDSLFSAARAVALERNVLLDEEYNFCWVKGSDIVNSITYGAIAAPNIVVYDTKTFEFYLYTDVHKEQQNFAKELISQFLLRASRGEVPKRGGSGFFQQALRMFYDLVHIIVGLFQDSPITGSLVIGIPTLVITFLCYCLCTLDDGEVRDDYSDDSEEEEEDMQEDQIKDESTEQLPDTNEPKTEGMRKRNVMPEPEEKK